MGLLERIEAARTERRYAADAYLTDYLIPSMSQWGYGDAYNGLRTSWGMNNKVEEFSATLPGHSAAVRACPPAFAAQMVRALVLSQVRFTFRNLPSSRTPRRLFGTQALSVLETPWPGATTGELVTRMEWHAGLAGNAYVTNYWPGRLRVLRPDWVSIVFGSKREPEDAAFALDGELLGYAYINGGISALGRNELTMLLPDEVAHWAPLPDPEGADIGMSWVSAAMRDILGDRAATEHKNKFFAHGATPNLVIKGIKAPTKAQFDQIVEAMDQRHSGVANAYRSLYLTEGADATVIGSDLKQLDFKATQGAGETRIAMLGRVPAPLLGISEGLSGSSLNSGNFGMARRIFADSWIYPTLQDLAGSLARLVKVPGDAELWFDTADMPILREDARDAAEIEQIKASTISAHITSGFDPQSAIDAVRGQDISLLKHSGLVSVQLQPPGTEPQAVTAGGAAPKAPAATAARALADDDDDYGDDEAVDALLVALDELDEEWSERWDPKKHPRNPDGRFRTLVERLIHAITEHHKGGGKGDPLEGFDRPQLLKVAKQRGIKLDRGEPRESIIAKLMADIAPGKKAKVSAPKPDADKPTPKRPAAARNLDALDAAPKYSRVIQEAGFTPEKRREYAEKLAALSPEQAHKLGGAKLRATLPADAPPMSAAERGSITKAAASYMGEGYKPINRSLYSGDAAPDDVQAEIDNLDKLFEMSRLDTDVILHRGTRATDIPDEWTSPAYSSTTALDKVAHDFAHGEFGGVKTGSADMEGTPTVLHIRVPKGHPAVQMTDENLAGEVLLPRGTSYRKLADRGVIDGVRHVDVEVVPWERPPSSTAGTSKTSLPKISGTKDLTANFQNAKTGTAALDAAPLNATNLHAQLTSAGLSNDEAIRTDMAFSRYRGLSFKPITQYLLGKDDSSVLGKGDQDVPDLVDWIDRAFEHSELTDDVIVYRGERNTGRNFPAGEWSLTGGMEGKEWTFDAFASTSTDEEQTFMFAKGATDLSSPTAQPTSLRILVPKGTKAINIDSESFHEREMLLHRRLHYRVVKDYGLVKTKHGYVRKLDVVVVP